MVGGLMIGVDGVPRCPWGDAPADYREYHDHEWGRPVRGDNAVFERITLEVFQSGLSWLKILRRREGFRAAFAGFRIERIAAFGPADRDRLMADAGIIRNRRKIDATIGNARAASDLLTAGGAGALEELVAAHAPTETGLRAEGLRRPPQRMSDVATRTRASTELATELRRLGFAHTGPTTMWALMTAIGLVDDHLLGCHRRDDRQAGALQAADAG